MTDYYSALQETSPPRSRLSAQDKRPGVFKKHRKTKTPAGQDRVVVAECAGRNSDLNGLVHKWIALKSWHTCVPLSRN